MIDLDRLKPDPPSDVASLAAVGHLGVVDEVIYVRVELHVPKGGDEYDALHRRMAKLGFLQFYKDKALPEGTYVSSRELSLHVALEAVKRVAHLVCQEAEIAVVKGSLATDGLKDSLGRKLVEAARTKGSAREKMDRIFEVFPPRFGPELDRASEFLVKNLQRSEEEPPSNGDPL